MQHPPALLAQYCKLRDKLPLRDPPPISVSRLLLGICLPSVFSPAAVGLLQLCSASQELKGQRFQQTLPLKLKFAKWVLSSPNLFLSSYQIKRVFSRIYFVLSPLLRC